MLAVYNAIVAGWREHCLDRPCSGRSQAVAWRQDPAQCSDLL